MRTLVLCLALAGCGASDPCAGHSGACLSLRVEDRGGVGTLDQLAIQLSGAAQLDGRTPTTAGSAVKLPVTTAIFLPAASGDVDISVVALRGGLGVGQGTTTAAIRPGAHVAATIALDALGGGVVDLAVGADLAHGDGGGVVDLASADLSGTQPRYIFLLPQHSGNLGAQSGLDTECTTSATTAGLPATTYRAVIAYPTVSPRDVIVLGAGRAIVLPDGTPVATDATFFAQSHAGPINELANGQVAAGCVFTDFNPNGDRINAAAGDCGGWTGLTTDVAYVGDSTKSDLNWNFADTPSCNGVSCYLYCIQQ
jgi:hypothetical protein